MKLSQYDKNTVEHMQNTVGAKVDGVFGLETLTRLSDWYTNGKGTQAFRPNSSEYCGDTISDMQRVIGTTTDGLWGPKTLRKLSEWYLANKVSLSNNFLNAWEGNSNPPKTPVAPVVVNQQVVGRDFNQLIKSMPDCVFGLDISKWQDKVDYAKVLQSGLRFVIVKASHGGKSKDPLFNSHWNGLKGGSIARGAYHYALLAWQGKEANPEDQAKNLWDSLKNDPGEFPACIDLEPGDIEDYLALYPSKTEADRLNAAQKCVGWIQRFCTQFETLFGYRPLFYWHRNIVHMLRSYADVFQNEMSWWALYPKEVKLPVSLPPGHPKGFRFDIWQFSSDGKLDGVKSNVDMNFWNGSHSDFDNFLKNWKK